MKPSEIELINEINEKTRNHLIECYDLAEKYSRPVNEVMQGAMGSFLYFYKATTDATSVEFAQFVNFAVSNMPKGIEVN